MIVLSLFFSRVNVHDGCNGQCNPHNLHRFWNLVKNRIEDSVGIKTPSRLKVVEIGVPFTPILNLQRSIPAVMQIPLNADMPSMNKYSDPG